MTTEPKTTAQILDELIAETGPITLTETEATELRSAARQIKELFSALLVAAACRNSDPNGQRICGPCWANVTTIAMAIDSPTIEVRSL